MSIERVFIVTTVAVALAATSTVAGAAEPLAPKQPRASASLNAQDRGRYMVIVGGCNDCHTAGFAARGGDVPEREWLKGGGNLGFSGPWGTTYASNLRLVLAKMTEAQWVRYAKELKTRPPMPWFNLNQWTDADLRSFYKYVRGLGPPGDAAPSFIPAETKPTPPVIQWPEPPK